jgi:hypothetical protein
VLPEPSEHTKRILHEFRRAPEFVRPVIPHPSASFSVNLADSDQAVLCGISSFRLLAGGWEDAKAPSE